MQSRTERIAATASNKRPALLVSGELIPLLMSAVIGGHWFAFRSTTLRCSGKFSLSLYALRKYDAAIRHGCLIAAVPPGIGTASRWRRAQTSQGPRSEIRHPR